MNSVVLQWLIIMSDFNLWLAEENCVHVSSLRDPRKQIQIVIPR